MYSLNLFPKLLTALLIGPAENSPIASPVPLSIQKQFWLQMNTAKKIRTSLFIHDISTEISSNLEDQLAVVPSQSFADNSHAGNVERHTYAQSSMHLAESAAPSGSSRFSLMKLVSRN